MTDTEIQRHYWNVWNAEKRARALSETSARQRRVVLDWLKKLDRTDMDLLEVGCGAAWMSPWLKPFGHVTATDLSDEAVRAAAERIPDIQFIPGDFFSLSFAPESYDVVVSLEVLSHVGDQQEFVSRIAALLRPGGYLMLATQNRPVLEQMNTVPPTEGQVRRWVDKTELAALLTPTFDVLELFSATPRGNRGVWRFINSTAVNAPIRAVVGNRFERLKERMGLGWTLMALARKRV